MDKFKMELTWHNCKTCPPQESKNDFLIVTDGDDIFTATWSNVDGYRVKHGVSCYEPYISGSLHYWWWADITRTIHSSLKFLEV